MVQTKSGQERGRIGARRAAQGCVVSALLMAAPAALAQDSTSPVPQAGQVPAQTAVPEQEGATPAQVTAPTQAAVPAQRPAAPAAEGEQAAAVEAAAGEAPPDGTTAPVGVPSPQEVVQQGAEFSQVDLNAAPLSLLPVADKSAGGWTAADVAARAQRVSPRVHSADATAARMAEQADDAISLFLPRAELKASYTRLSTVREPDPSAFGFPTAAPDGMADAMASAEADSGFAKAFGINMNNRYVLQATVTIPISDFFLSLRDYYKSAQTTELVAEYQRKGERAAVANDAKQSYYELARAVAAHNLSQHRVEQLARFTAEISVLVDGGELSSVELAQSRAREASAMAALERSVAGRRIAEQALRRQVGLDFDAPIAIGEPLLEQRPNTVGELKPLVEAALNRRPEAQALVYLIQANSETRDAVTKTRFPSLSLFGTANYDNPNQRLVPPEERFYGTWAVGAEITWSPSEYVVKAGDIKDAQLQVVKARDDLNALKDRIIIEVTQAYENARAAAGAVSAAEQAVMSAQEALDVSLSLFHAGEATSRQVLDAELDLRIAQLDYVDNMLATHLAVSSLEYATGGALSQPAQ